MCLGADLTGGGATDYSELLGGLQLRPGARGDVLDRLSDYAGVALPEDYVEFLRFSNGVRGDFGPRYWLELWPAEDVPRLNTVYAKTNRADGALLIGTDGGGTAFAIDTRPRRPGLFEYVQFGFPLLEWGEEEHRAPSLRALFNHLRAP